MFKMYKFDVFSPLHFTLIMLFFYTIAKYFLMYMGLSKYPLNTFQSTDFVTMLIVLQFTYIFIFYTIFKHFNYDRYINFAKKHFTYSITSVRKIKFANIFIITLVILLYELYYRSIGTSLLQFGTINPEVIKNMSGNNPIMYILVKGFADTLLMIWTMILAYFVIIEKKYRFEMLILVLTIMFLAFFNGSRGAFIMGTFFPMLIIYNAFKRRLSIFYLIIFFVFTIAMLGVLGILRAATAGIGIDELINILSSLDDKISYIFLSILDRRMDAFYPNLLHVFDNIEKFDYRYGFDYVNIFLQNIPRFLWEDKPLSLVREANNILVIQDTGGVGFSSIFEAWMNFGMLGLVFNAIMAAYVLNLFQKMYIYAKKNNELIIFIISVKIGTGIVMKFFISSGITHNTAEFTFIMIKFFLALLLIKKITI